MYSNRCQIGNLYCSLSVHNIHMNIFVLDKCPIMAASYHCDKHVVKMILESKQLLVESWHYHPATKWTSAHNNHGAWVSRLGYNLCLEYTKRYKKTHEYEKFFSKQVKAYGESINDLPFKFFGPQELLAEADNDVVTAYRLYYIRVKYAFAKWTNVRKPKWYLHSYLMPENEQVAVLKEFRI